jgi:hypothetical protein
VTSLPAIGRPATRALETQGVTTLEQVATWSRRDLLALHGVGPKAVRILEHALGRVDQVHGPLRAARTRTPAALSSVDGGFAPPPSSALPTHAPDDARDGRDSINTP